ncbi:Crp/Fnr family transcriptional regulator [Corynebacterium sp. TAE3-ERU12]|uniref:Crp/Fnr family transcriptional regulator n=1 Tax=Corynebacterium sp. TAE3-ERU12 TaxID=2849491 RepID=UPI001C4677AA|nr:Crp/Fnr family transcriptional regulator [Corynebacterium sp. TAE3-ERU12]MBV7296024.1 Crp/Fnr family transcriptional regulator [Corynebacterium sp. TAE3-ERU12]
MSTAPAGAANNPQNPPVGQRPCLREVELFQQIPEAELAEINRMIPPQNYSSGQVVYNPLRPTQELFIIKSGRVRIYQSSPGGKIFTLAIYETGDVFGNMPTVGQVMGDSYADVIEETVICRLNENDVEKFFLADPRISQQVTTILARRVAELEQRLTDIALRPLSQRMASLLLTTARPSHLPWEKGLVVKMTHEQLASLAGATREAVSKVLADLAQRGLITQKRGSIVIIHPHKLQEFKDGIDE